MRFTENTKESSDHQLMLHAKSHGVGDRDEACDGQDDGQKRGSPDDDDHDDDDDEDNHHKADEQNNSTSSDGGDNNGNSGAASGMASGKSQPDNNNDEDDEDYDGASEATEPALPPKKHHPSIFHNALRPNSAVRQLFPSVGGCQAGGIPPTVLTHEALRAFEEAKRGPCASAACVASSVVHSDSETDTIRRTIERNALRRSLIKYVRTNCGSFFLTTC